MGRVKNHPSFIQGDTHARPVSLRHLGTQGAEESFNLISPDISPDRPSENIREGATVFGGKHRPALINPDEGGNTSCATAGLDE
jgi:hypothetical protein